MATEEFARYLDDIHTNGKFAYEDDQTKEIIKQCMKSGVRPEIDCIHSFKRILSCIERGAGTKDFITNRKNGKYANFLLDRVKDYNMGILFEPIEEKKDEIITKRYKIYGVLVVKRKARKIIFPPNFPYTL